MKRLVIWVKVLYSFINSLDCNKNSLFLTAKETIDEVIVKNKSLIRLGDGEFNILEGKDVHYQKHSLELQKNIELIINKYIDNPKESNYLLCMPGEYLACSGLSLLRKKRYVASWSFSRYLFKKRYDKDIQYGDSFVFADQNEEIYRKIWQDSNVENVIFVHNDIVYADKFTNKYNINTVPVIIPCSNSFDEKDQILNEIKQKFKNYPNAVVLISAGPTAKYLVYQLAQNNIRAIDTGHCWDKPLKLREK